MKHLLYPTLNRCYTFCNDALKCVHVRHNSQLKKSHSPNISFTVSLLATVKSLPNYRCLGVSSLNWEGMSSKESGRNTMYMQCFCSSSLYKPATSALVIFGDWLESKRRGVEVIDRGRAHPWTAKGAVV